MRKYLSVVVGMCLLAGPAFADWTGKDASGATITFKNANACSSVVCVPVAAPVDSTGAAFGVTANPFFVSPATGATFPISATALPLPTGAATQTTSAAILTALGSPFQAGASIANTSFGISGTLPAFAATPTVNLGTIGGVATQTTLASVLTALGSPFQAGASIGNTSFTATQATASNLNMTCANCSGSGASGTDEGGFTAGSSVFAPGGGFFQTTATSNPLTTGQWGAWQLTANRAGFVNLRNAAGAEVGTASTPVQVSLANTAANATAMLVTGTGGTFPVSQATAANLNATVVGTGTFATQATLQASAATAIGTVNPNTIGNWGLSASTQNTTTPTNMALMAGQFNTTPTTITSGNTSPFQLDNAGNLLVNIKAGAGSGGTALTDQAAFTQGTTQITPIGCLFISSYSAITTGHAGVASCSNTGALNVQVTNTNINGSTTSANSAPVVIASDQVAVASKAASGAYVAGAIADLAHGQGTMAASVPVAIASNQSAVPTNQTQYNSVAVVSNPCLTGTILYIPISQATSTQVASLGGSSKKNYVCSIAIVGSDAENISVVEGTGTVCATTPAAIIGGTTAANGINSAANGGITFGNGAAPIAAGSLTSLNNVCILQSGTGRVAGSMVVAQQ